jgi:hypothetical protein
MTACVTGDRAMALCCFGAFVMSVVHDRVRAKLSKIFSRLLPKAAKIA